MPALSPGVHELSSHWRLHSGECVAIVGNGPSLIGATCRDVEGADVVLGVHSVAWHAALRSRLDYWLCVDNGPADTTVGTVPMKDGSTWRLGPPACHAILRGLVIDKGHFVDPLGNDRTPHDRTVLEGYQTEEEITSDQVSEQAAKNGTLFMVKSSIMPALHLALLWGAREIRLVGVDAGGAPRNWDDTREMPPRKLESLREHREQLERFARYWGDRVRLVNTSPTWHREPSRWLTPEGVGCP